MSLWDQFINIWGIRYYDGYIENHAKVTQYASYECFVIDIDSLTLTQCLNLTKDLEFCYVRMLYS